MWRKIRWRIVIPYSTLILLAMAGLTLFISDRVRRFQVADLQEQLLTKAQLVAADGASLLADGDPAVLDPLARDWANLLNVRVTLIRSDGLVVGESHQDRKQMDNHLDRPEVQQALSFGQGQSIRFSRTVGYEMIYVAVAVHTDGEITGIVRVSLSLEQVETHVAGLRRTVLIAALLTTMLTLLLALLIAERIARPIRQLTRVAERIVAGDLEARLFPTTQDEVGQLTLAFNRLADHMQQEIAALSREHGRLAGVLEHMADGVIITDQDGQVLLVNPAVARLLGTAEGEATGRSFAQLVRHYQLVNLWKRCRDLGEEQTGLLELSHRRLFLQVILTPLSEDGSAGFLVILQDLTRVRQLETVRRDFVSNVSHELLTPLASLKALVETLRGGALEDPATAERFLDRAETEVDMLTQMVQELLALSLIESGRAPLHLRPTTVEDVLVRPVERLRPQAERAGLSLSVDLPSGIPMVLADLEQIGRVVTNLVHNAIKFTPEGGEVTVSVAQVGTEVVLAVRDTGVGIPKEDLPRIFERFYKADRARSGGGTGLGLAIAKHIVQGHGGRIWVESVEGRGSTFYFSLPLAKETPPR